MESLIKSKSLSVFKLVILLLIAVYLHNIFIYTGIIFYLFCDNNKKAIVFIVMMTISILINNIHYDYMRIGIVDYKKNNYYVVDKLFYKVQIYDEDINIGDILLFTNQGEYLDNLSYNKRNIQYKCDSYTKIFNFYPRLYLYERINNPYMNNSSLLNNLIYNINEYSDNYVNIGFGLASFYVLDAINKKSQKIGLISLITYSLLFVFEIKFVFILIDNLSKKRSYDLHLKSSLKILLILLTNIKLLNNYSILLTVLFFVYSCFNLSIDFSHYLIIIQSLLFGEINILYLFLFRQLKKLRIILLFLAIITIFINDMSYILNYFPVLFKTVNNQFLSIRGSISLISLFLFYYLVNKLDFPTIIKSILLCLLIINPFNNPFLHITFIDVGQGDCIMIKNPLNHRCILIDTGSKYNYHKLKTYLFKEGIYTIDKLIITHDDTDHNGNINSLLNDFSINEIVVSGKDIEYDLLFLKYYDLGRYDNDNDNSLVYSINIDNMNFLFTGDISSEIEYKLLKLYGPLDVDVLKASHHGSKTGNSDYFIANIMPKYVVISTSGQYNHPHQKVIDTLNRYDVNTYITCKDSHISFYFNSLFTYLKTGKGQFVIIK